MIGGFMSAFGSRERYLDKLYSDFCLCGVWMRQCPDYIDDSVVAEHLIRCGLEESLPWSIEDQKLFWK